MKTSGLRKKHKRDKEKKKKLKLFGKKRTVTKKDGEKKVIVKDKQGNVIKTKVKRKGEKWKEKKKKDDTIKQTRVLGGERTTTKFKRIEPKVRNLDKQLKSGALSVKEYEKQKKKLG
jgi:hypothetical protein